MWQLVFMINGCFIGILGGTMLLVAGYDMYANAVSWSYFLNAGFFTLFIGTSLFLSNRCTVDGISLRQGYLLTVSSWLSISLLSAIPFWLYDCVPDISDAVFEAVSGISGTGATIFADVESLPKPILLWRSCLNLMGGVGVVIFASALLPFLGIGGMQIFQRENSDINDKFMPKFQYIAKRIIFVYVFLTICCIIGLRLVGMNWFDAINHGFATASTSGFSTKNTSIGYYNSQPIEAVVMFFMLASALPMTFFVMLLQNKSGHSLRSMQVGAFLKTVLIIVLLMSLWLRLSGVSDNMSEALRYSAFNVISVITTTGFSSVNFLQWGAFAVSVFAVISLIGGCPGSTTGSIKFFRWQVVGAFLKQACALAITPQRVIPLKIKNFVIAGDVVSSVLVFTSLFLVMALVLILAMTMIGVDFFTALASVLSCITNVGPGIVESIGPDGNFSFFSPSAKYILAFAMLLGRLEILTILVVFTRGFWKD